MAASSGAPSRFIPAWDEAFPTSFMDRLDWREANVPRQRVRFLGATLTHRKDAHCHVEVRLEWKGVEYRGQAEGVGLGPIDQRVAAEAAIQALDALFQGRLRFRLVGTKAVRAFDDTVAVVAVGIQNPGEHEQRLVGAALYEGHDVARGVTRAVLNATNRALGSFLHTSARD